MTTRVEFTPPPGSLEKSDPASPPAMSGRSTDSSSGLRSLSGSISSSPQSSPLAVIGAFLFAGWAAHLVTQIPGLSPEYKFWGTVFMAGCLLLPVEVWRPIALGVASGIKRRIGGGR